MAPQRGTGFTDIGQYLAANQGTLANEAAGLTSNVNGELDKAKTDADAAYANVQPGTLTDYTQVAGYGNALDEQTQAQTDAGSLGSAGGIQWALQKQGDTADQGAFDSQLLVGNPDVVAGVGAAQQKASLGDYLDSVGKNAARPAPVIVDDPDGWNGVTPTGPGSGNPLGTGHPGAPPTQQDPNTPPGESGKKKTPYGGF